MATRTRRIKKLAVKPVSRSEVATIENKVAAQPISLSETKVNPLFMGLGDTYSPDVNSRHVEFHDELNNENRKAIDDLYTDLLIQKSVFTPINDSLSEWREIKDAVLKDYDKTLNIKRVIIDVYTAFKKYGHVIILPVLVDRYGVKVPFGIPLRNILDRQPVVQKLLVIDDFTFDEGKITDVLSDDYGKHKQYQINDKPVHPSRIILMGDENTDSFVKNLAHYHNSFHDRTYETTRAVKESNFLTLGTDFDRLSEQILSSIDNIEALSPNVVRTMVVEAVENRAKNLRSNSNNQNAYIYDKKTEEITELQKSTISAMANAAKDSLDVYNAAVDIPASRFLGKTTGNGFGANIDISNYVQTLNGRRSMEVEPVLKSLDEFLQNTDDKINDLSYNWNKLAIQQYNEIEDEAVETT